MPETCNFIKKETLAQVFSCEFCEISKNTFFTEQFRPSDDETPKFYSAHYKAVSEFSENVKVSA